MHCMGGSLEVVTKMQAAKNCIPAHGEPTAGAFLQMGEKLYEAQKCCECQAGKEMACGKKRRAHGV